MLTGQPSVRPRPRSLVDRWGPGPAVSLIGGAPAAVSLIGGAPAPPVRGTAHAEAMHRERRLPAAEPGGKRRALSHVGGSISFRDGSSDERRALEAALDVDPNEEATLPHVHGFHSYPARLHPETARRLIAELSREGATVLDPFCGSGTVPVEARLLGRRAVAVDLNPLAVALAGLKVSAPGLPWTRDIEKAAARVAEHADERRKKRAGAT